MQQYRTLIDYTEFVQRVRRHRPSELLPAIAANAIKFKVQADWTADSIRLPWALAAAAKTSIVAGSEHRDTRVTDKDIVQICAAYSALEDPLTRGANDVSGSAGAFLVRVSHEQFLPQQSQYEEISRLGALFDDVDQLNTKLINTALIQQLLGCTVAEFVGAGLVIAIGASSNAGYFDPSWPELWNGPMSIDAHFPMQTVQRVFDDHFRTDFGSFRAVAQELTQSDQSLRHHEFNPLVSRPFVTLPNGRHIAPQPMFAYQRLSPSAVYYAGVGNLNHDQARDFTDDMGVIFESYVGRQLRLLPNATVLPEIRYGKSQLSVDWFVVFDELVLLVEAKSTRLSLLARMGGNLLETDINRSVGKAFQQLKNTEQLIINGHPSFAHIPIDRPRLGVVATLEPYWSANSPLVRRLLPEPALPVTVASIRELERFVDVSRAHGDPTCLADVLRDPERREWNLENALPAEVVPRNPILQAAWATYPLRSEEA